MRTILKNTVLTAGAMLLCAAGTAGADTLFEAKVPFPFVVNGRTLPAGKYRVQRDEMRSTVFLIRNEQHHHPAAFVAVVPDSGKDPAGSHPALTFIRDEKEYRLSGIWSSDEGWDVARP
jgi:hypothetical protein